MQALSKAKIGEIYTIKWLLGLPEVVEFLHRHHVEEGGSIRIIQKLQTGMIVGVRVSDLLWAMKLQIEFRYKPKRALTLSE